MQLDRSPDDRLPTQLCSATALPCSGPKGYAGSPLNVHQIFLDLFPQGTDLVKFAVDAHEVL